MNLNFGFFSPSCSMFLLLLPLLQHFEMSSSNSVPSNTDEGRFLNINCKCNKRARVKLSESKSNPNRLYYCCQDNVCGTWLRWGVPTRKSEVEIQSNEAFCNEETMAYFLHKMDRCNNEVEKLKKENRNLAKKVEKLQHNIYCVRLGFFFCLWLLL